MLACQYMNKVSLGGCLGGICTWTYSSGIDIHERYSECVQVSTLSALNERPERQTTIVTCAGTIIAFSKAVLKVQYAIENSISQSRTRRRDTVCASQYIIIKKATHPGPTVRQTIDQL